MIPYPNHLPTPTHTGQPPVDLVSFLFDRSPPGGAVQPAALPGAAILAARARLQPLVGERNAAEFLALVLCGWLAAEGQPFAMFNEPCEHPCYHPGQSWQEQMGLGREAFRTARAAVACKIRRGTRRRELCQEALVLYWTEADRRTYYALNEDLLCQRMSEHVGIPLVMPVSLRMLPHSTVPAPEPVSGGIPSWDPNGAKGGFPPVLKKGLESTVTFSSGEKEEEVKIRKMLESRGVFTAPARGIAMRALQAGLEPTEVARLFDAHLAQVARTSRKADPLAVVVWRLLNVSLEEPERPPAPHAAAFLSALRESQEAGDERKQAAGGGQLPGEDGSREGAGEDPDTCDSCPGEGTPENPPAPAEPRLPDTSVSPATALWQEALGILQQQMTRATFERCLKGTQLEAAGEDYYRVLAPDPGAVPWLDRRLRPLVERTLEGLVGRAVAVGFAARGDLAPVGEPVPVEQEGAQRQEAVAPSPADSRSPQDGEGGQVPAEAPPSPLRGREGDLERPSSTEDVMLPKTGMALKRTTRGADDVAE